MSPIDLFQALRHPCWASIPYVDLFNPDRPLVLECFRPPRHDPDKPVVIVQHGACRNGALIRAWHPAGLRFHVEPETAPQEWEIYSKLDCDLIAVHID